MTVECQYCRRPEPGTCRVESRHTTSEGVLVYVRCACGRLQRHLVPNAELRSWYGTTTAAPAPEPSPAVTAA